MYPSQHLIFGFIFSLIIFFIFPSIGVFGLITIAAASILIDTDHYLLYVWEKHDFNLRNSYKWYRKKVKQVLSLPKEERLKYYHGLYIFHGFEVLFILLLLSIFISKYFLFILTGFNIHLFLDMIADNRNYTKSFKYSIFVNLAYSKKLKHLED